MLLIAEKEYVNVKCQCHSSHQAQVNFSIPEIFSLNFGNFQN